MKIEIKNNDRKTSMVVDGEVTLYDVYSGVGIQTDAGLFGVAQRDGGIEVMLDGTMLFASTSKPLEELELYGDLRVAVAMMATILEHPEGTQASEILERPAVANAVRHSRAYLEAILSQHRTTEGDPG